MKVYKAGSRWVVRGSVYAAFGDKGDAYACRDGLRASLAKLKSNPRDGKCCTIHDQLHNFIRDCINGNNRKPCNEHTAAVHRRRLERFDRVFHSKPLSQISAKEIDDYRDRRLEGRYHGRRISRDTVNNEIGTLKMFASWAQKKKLAPAGLPLETVGRFWEPGKLPGRNQKPPVVLEFDEVLEIVDRMGAERPDMRLFFDAILLFCLRPAAVAKLRRGDVYISPRTGRGKLQVEKLKGGIDRSLEVHPGTEANEWVQACLRMGDEAGLREPGAPLVPCLGGRSRINPGGWTSGSFCEAVRRMREKLQIARPFTPYVVRHATVSFLQDQEGISAANVQTAAAHLRVTTQENYSHRKAREAVPAYRLLGDYLRDWRRSRGDI